MQNFIIRQKIRPLANQYAVYKTDLEHPDQPGPLVAFAHQKRFAFKETFTLYTGEDKQTVAFTIKARQVLDFGARYDIRDADGTLLGVVGKNFKASLLRSTWQVFAADNEDKPLLIAQERSKALAITRRIWELLPYISDIPFFVKYHFDFSDPDNGQLAATYVKTATLRDFYLLSIIGGAAEAVDSRVLIGLGIMLDAMQSR